ncbi:hypothetical protein [Hufsiella ginkgonis]|uniref:Uncharacterized protein n=1 Tax=Hufsiella ginkgonis TaxID=2695274 RepID=A0A7K1XSM9_9SPHI|nr:hypothetical protein [Hufsiella ginkgonis]MXV13749.1 hypothetical protein [Hufsiella ginkgonis]
MGYKRAHSMLLSPKLRSFAGGILLIFFFIPLSVQMIHAHTDSVFTYKKDSHAPVVHKHQAACRICDYYVHKQPKGLTWAPPASPYPCGLVETNFR